MYSSKSSPRSFSNQPLPQSFRIRKRALPEISRSSSSSISSPSNVASASLENSNFNPGVIDACKKKAAEDGYELEISDCVYDAWQNMRAAQVALKYHYRIPVLGIYEENITYAIAR